MSEKYVSCLPAGVHANASSWQITTMYVSANATVTLLFQTSSTFCAILWRQIRRAKMASPVEDAGNHVSLHPVSDAVAESGTTDVTGQTSTSAQEAAGAVLFTVSSLKLLKSNCFNSICVTLQATQEEILAANITPVVVPDGVVSVVVEGGQTSQGVVARHYSYYNDTKDMAKAREDSVRDMICGKTGKGQGLHKLKLLPGQVTFCCKLPLP